MLRIERAAGMRLVREMLEQYGRATHVDLSFQNFEQELASLPCAASHRRHDLRDEAALCVAPAGAQITLTVPAQSITLLVIPRVGIPVRVPI